MFAIGRGVEELSNSTDGSVKINACNLRRFSIAEDERNDVNYTIQHFIYFPRNQLL
jgi:hypothetical protein